MTTSFEFSEPTHFAAGAIGEPGQRVFYLQAGDDTGLIALKLEKQQVMALAQFLRGVLDDFPSPASPVSLNGLIEPIEPAWVVGQIAVGVDEADAEIVVMIEELVPFDEEGDEDAEEPDLFGDVSTGSTMRLQINSAQAASFVAQADALVSQGRPPCRLCGQPEDPGGHACPRLN